MSEPQERTLVSSRLALEPIQGRHGDLLFDVLQDASIYTYIPMEPPDSSAALQLRYEWLAQQQSPEGDERWLNWAIRLIAPPVESASVYMGPIQVTVAADAIAFLAYELGSAYRGAGYATEACQMVMREVVEVYGVHEMRAHVDARNERSILLLERLGFSRVAHIAEADFFKGASSDEYVYSWVLPSINA